jgi:teichuronic acid biosynthesis glycosyltransferase TuaC
MVGAVAHEQVPQWLGAADVACMPSLREGHPNAAMEALACGRPLVAGAVGALPAMVTQQCGLLVLAGEVDSLSGARAAALCRPWDAAAIAVCVQGASWQEAADRYLRTCARAIADTTNESLIGDPSDGYARRR